MRGDVTAKIGDRLEIEGLIKVYCHWAVVSEIGKVNRFLRRLRGLFHKPPDDGDFCFKMMHFTGYTGIVEIQNIREYGRRLRINNSRDQQNTVLSPHQIRLNIKNITDNPDLIGQYNLLTNNCEDIVNYIRYGMKESDQTVAYIHYIGDVLRYLLPPGSFMFAWFIGDLNVALVVLTILVYLKFFYQRP